MATNITNYPNVRRRIQKLECIDPLGFSLLPINFESVDSAAEFRQVSETATVKTLLKSANLPYSDIVPPERRPPYIHDNALEWFGPTLFISANLISQNQDYVTMALDIIATYLTDLIRGFGSGGKVKLEIVVEQSKENACKKISYEGTPEGLREIAEIIKAADYEQ